MAVPHFETNPVTGDVVIVAEERAARPIQVRRQNLYQSHDACPFCPGHEDETPQALASHPDEAHWQVRVVPNKYPATGDVAGDNAVTGVHEVVIETRDHVDTWTSLPPANIDLIFRTFRERYRCAADNRQRNIQFVQVFKNARAAAGASILHTHSQILGVPRVPPRAHARISLAEQQNSCPLCDWVDSPAESTTLIDDPEWLVACPMGSRFPFQTWFIPKTHLCDFADCGDEAVLSLGRLVVAVTKKMEDILQRPAYNFAIHSLPVSLGVKTHWFAELFPKTTVPGGFEWSSGAYINPVAPRTAATRLRAENC